MASPFLKKRKGGSNSEDRERFYALVAGISSSPSFIIDSGASRHMVSIKEEAFTSLDMSKGPPIYWEMTLSMKFWAKGGLILTMVSSAMYCMFQVLPLTSCQCIR